VKTAGSLVSAASASQVGCAAVTSNAGANEQGICFTSPPLRLRRFEAASAGSLASELAGTRLEGTKLGRALRCPALAFPGIESQASISTGNSRSGLSPQLVCVLCATCTAWMWPLLVQQSFVKKRHAGWRRERSFLYSLDSCVCWMSQRNCFPCIVEGKKEPPSCELRSSRWRYRPVQMKATGDRKEALLILSGRQG